ncbi:histidine phosphatase superfamily [Gongronella butleri]|nr:histidine phosphatase superfamily [Gongronella butleri]
MVKEIWITRHGFREDWVNPTPFYPTGLTFDPPLSAEGRQQAEELAVFLKDKQIQHVYTSSFYRVLETVRPLAEATQVPVSIDYLLSEWYGHQYQEYRRPAPVETMQGLFPSLAWAAHESSVPCPSGTESMEECHARTHEGIHRLIAHLDTTRPEVERILFAGHAATVITAVRALLKDSQFYVNAGTCSVSKLVRDEADPQKWHLVVNGDCAHLSGGEQRAWMFSGNMPKYDTYQAQ